MSYLNHFTMKKQKLFSRIAATVLLLLAGMCAATYAQTNLVVNPDFEQWTDGLPDGWEFDDVATISTDNVFEGTYAVRQRVLVTRMWQEVQGIMPGEEYVISYWFYDDDPDARSRIWAHWTAGDELLDADAVILRPETFSEDSDAWQQFEVTLTAPPGADGFRFEVRSYDDGGGGGAVYYDSFAMIGEPPVVNGGHETFDNLEITGASYQSGTFLGQDGSDWTFVQCRGDREIDGKAIMVGRSTTPQSHFYSGVLEGGISTLTFDYMQAFTTNVNLEVHVNDQVVAVVTSDDQQNVVLNSGVIDVHVQGDVTLKFIGVSTSSGQVVVDNINWTFYDESEVPEGPQITNVSHFPDVSISPFTEVDVQAAVSSVQELNHVELRWGTESAVYTYTINMEDAGGGIYQTASPIPAQDFATTVYYQVYAEDVQGAFDTSAEMSYSVDVPVEAVSSLADLRSQDVDAEAIYQLSEEVVITWQLADENKVYVQDATAAIVLLDEDGLMQEDYALYDGISGIAGRLWQDGQTLCWIPVVDPGEASSWVNIVHPLNVSITELIANPADYQSRLVKLTNVHFPDPEGVFESGENYTINKGEETYNFHTLFAGADYIGESIPEETLILTGIIGMGDAGSFITARKSDDIQDSSLPMAFSVVFTVIDDSETLDNILFAGDMTGWNMEEMLEDPSYNWSVTLNLPPGSYAWNAMGNNGQDSPFWLIPDSHLNVTVTEDGNTTGDLSFVYMLAGTSDLEMSVVKMYPNPAGTYLHIEADYGITEVKVQNVHGEVLYNSNPTGVLTYDLNVGMFTPGLYVVSVYTDDGMAAEKIQVE
jgi:hypothetical protein